MSEQSNGLPRAGFVFARKNAKGQMYFNGKVLMGSRRVSLLLLPSKKQPRTDAEAYEVFIIPESSYRRPGHLQT